ncbi:MAG: rhomboid family intramembrane serine protease [bacterium]
MFPIRDHNPSTITPYVTWGLIAVNAAVFLLGNVVQPSEIARNYFEFEWGMIPARLSYGQGWITLLSSMFLHAGWLHLGGNMLFLWIFGDNLEAAMGRLRYLVFYLTCGVIAAGSEYLAAPWANYPVIGASGAIAGVLGGYLLLYPKARVDVLIIFVIFFRVFPIPAWIVLGLWIAMQLFSGALGQNDGVAYWEHIGGFAAGLVLCLPLWLRQRRIPPMTPSHIPTVPRNDATK